MSELQLHTKLGSFTFVAPIRSPGFSNGYANPIDAARNLGTDLASPKVVAVVLKGVIHVAVGFTSDLHREIADSAFNERLGSEWRRQARSYGGGFLELSFKDGTVRIKGCATSLDSLSVPKSAQGVIVEEVRQLMRSGDLDKKD